MWGNIFRVEETPGQTQTCWARLVCVSGSEGLGQLVVTGGLPLCNHVSPTRLEPDGPNRGAACRLI